jgi:hypothetical protein
MTPILSLRTRPEPKKKPALKSLRQRVLVVEDELIIGEIAAEALADAGYEVLTAASAEEAEIILRDVSVDVLFTDINLGGQDGFELAQAALSCRLSLPQAARGPATACARQWECLSLPSLTASQNCWRRLSAP